MSSCSSRLGQENIVMMTDWEAVVISVLWTFQNNSYVPLPPSLKNSWTCFWGLQVERNIPASGVRDVGHLFPLLSAQLFHIRHVRKKCASFRLAEQRKPIAIGFCNSLLIFFLRFYRLIRFLYWPPARENPRLPLATACNFFNGRIKNRNQRPSTLRVAHQFGFDCLLPNVILMMIWLFNHVVTFKWGTIRKKSRASIHCGARYSSRSKSEVLVRLWMRNWDEKPCAPVTLPLINVKQRNGAARMFREIIIFQFDFFRLRLTDGPVAPWLAVACR